MLFQNTALRLGHMFPVAKMRQLSSWHLLLPLYGSMVFFILYFLAAVHYPGGTHNNVHSVGFSWTENYWCNLLPGTALNGKPNTARPFALAGMLVLVLSLTSFWFLFTQHTGLKKSQQLLIRVSGTLSMATVFFLTAPFHDRVINIATLLGLVAVGGIFVALHRLGWKNLLWLGLINLLLIGVNNLLYYGPGLQTYLPAVQKFTFLYFLIWVCLVTVQVFVHKNRNV